MDGTWAEHRLHITEELDRLSKGQVALFEKCDDIVQRLSRVEVRVGIIGGTAGGFAAIAVLVVSALLGGDSSNPTVHNPGIQATPTVQVSDAWAEQYK